MKSRVFTCDRCGKTFDNTIDCVNHEKDCTGATDNVNHPSHYTQGGIECIEAIKAAVVGKRPVEAYLVGNIIKYVWRYEAKNGVEDLKKACWYLNRLIEERSFDEEVKA